MNKLNRFKKKVVTWGTSRAIRATEFEAGEEVYVFSKGELDFLKSVLK